MIPANTEICHGVGYYTQDAARAGEDMFEYKDMIDIRTL